MRVARLMVLDWELLSQFCDLKPEHVEGSVYSLTLSKKLIPNLVSEIMSSQFDDPKLQRIRDRVLEGKSPDFFLMGGVLYFRKRLCVP